MQISESNFNHFEYVIAESMVILFFFWETSTLYSVSATPFSSQQCTRVPISSHYHQEFLLSFLIVCILEHLWWYLNVVLIDISLMVNDGRHFPMFISHLYLLWKNVKVFCTLFLLSWFEELLHVFQMLIPSYISWFIIFILYMGFILQYPLIHNGL